MTAVLGISASYHDSAAALVIDGTIVAAAQEERFTRVKHDKALPTNAIDYCLAEAGLQPSDVDYFGFYEKPYLRFERLLETYLAFSPVGFRSFLRAMPVWLREKLHIPRQIRKGLQGQYRKGIVFVEHHESHAASAFTYFTGFRVDSGEYKLMGLAPYGEPRFVDIMMKELLERCRKSLFRAALDGPCGASCCQRAWRGELNWRGRPAQGARSGWPAVWEGAAGAPVPSSRVWELEAPQAQADSAMSSSVSGGA